MSSPFSFEVHIYYLFVRAWTLHDCCHNVLWVHSMSGLVEVYLRIGRSVAVMLVTLDGVLFNII